MASKKRRGNEPAPGWAWMLLGLSIGLAVALAVYLTNGGPTIPSARIPDTAAVVEPPAPAQVVTPAPAASMTEAEAEPAADADLDFYELLQELTVVVPDGDPAARAENRPAQEYTIQAGSFRTYEEADRRQATLALLAIESHIENAIVENQIWHRVIIGPLSERGEMSRVLRSLRNERIETMAPRPVSR
jgi:cell division protein FtsN